MTRKLLKVESPYHLTWLSTPCLARAMAASRSISSSALGITGMTHLGLEMSSSSLFNLATGNAASRSATLSSAWERNYSTMCRVRFCALIISFSPYLPSPLPPPLPRHRLRRPLPRATCLWRPVPLSHLSPSATLTAVWLGYPRRRCRTHRKVEGESQSFLMLSADNHSIICGFIIFSNSWPVSHAKMWRSALSLCIFYPLRRMRHCRDIRFTNNSISTQATTIFC